MPTDPRDTLWYTIFETYYRTHFEETLSNLVIKRLQIIDFAWRALAAATASGSAVSGWALWQDPSSKIVWAAISGTAALLIIVHAALSVTDLLKQHITYSKGLTPIRHEFENLRDDLNINRDFDVSRKYVEFRQLRKRYSDVRATQPQSLFATRALYLRAQNILNRKISDMLE